MVVNLIDKLREKLFKEDSLVGVVAYIDTLNEEQKYQILRLMLSDYYKINFYNNLFYDTTSELSIFKEDIDDIIYSLTDNFNLMFEVLKTSKIFSNLDVISKILMMEELEKYNQDEFIISISKTYIIDKITYVFNYNLESFKEYYKDYIVKNKDVLNKRSRASNFITNKIIDYKEINYNEYRMFILEFLKIYYKWKIFIKAHDGIHLLFEEDLIYLNKIENTEIEELINEINNNYDFLSTIVGEYLHYKTSKTEIKEDMLDKYLIENTDYNFQKKLQIKGD